MIQATFQDDDLVWVNPSECRRLRNNAKLKQWEVVPKAGVIRRTVQEMESDRVDRQFQYFTVECVAGAYGVSPSELIDWEKTSQPTIPSSQPQPTTSSRFELREKYSAAIREPSRIRACQLLAEVADDAEKLIKSDNVLGLARIRADALKRLAELETNYRQHVMYRRDAIQTLLKSHQESNDWLDLLSLANRTVDYFYDQFNSEAKGWIQKRFADAAKRIFKQVEGLIEQSDADDTHATVLLLAQRASILRCQVQSANSQDHRLNRLQQMVRCADKARNTDLDNPVGHLEFGQAVWTQALYGRGPDIERNAAIAEESLQRSVDIGLNLGRLVQARFYRQRFQESRDLAEAIAAFRTYEQHETDRRQVLAESHIVGEAACHLWRRFEEHAVSDVEYSRNLVAEAVESGYTEARKVVTLAFLQAILDGVEAGTAVLARLSPEADQRWDQMLFAAQEYIDKQDFESLHKAFVFGVDQHGVWNQLGTFAREFLEDHDRALKLYEVGLKLSPRNQVLWLNKARLLKELGRFADAEYCLRNASNYSTQCFDRSLTNCDRSCGRRKVDVSDFVRAQSSCPDRS